jgi:hypothetical protein
MKIPKADVNNFYNGSNGGALSLPQSRCISDYLNTQLTTKDPPKANPAMASV